MARDAVTITALTMDAGAAMSAGTVINAANDAIIAGAADAFRLVIWVSNTESAEYDVTVVAPTDNPNAVRSGLGSLVIPVGAGKEELVCVESARFAQTDGSIHLDYETGFTGFAQAYRLPA